MTRSVGIIAVAPDFRESIFIVVGVDGAFIDSPIALRPPCFEKSLCSVPVPLKYAFWSEQKSSVTES